MSKKIRVKPSTQRKVMITEVVNGVRSDASTVIVTTIETGVDVQPVPIARGKCEHGTAAPGPCWDCGVKKLPCDCGHPEAHVSDCQTIIHDRIKPGDVPLGSS